jgi:RNA recognition motif-containing protein
MKIYVGNLNFSTTEDRLRQAFSAYGAVEEVAIPTDRETGRARGFGFVTMPNAEEAKAAMNALNGADLDGRPLKVNEAQPRRNEGGPGRPRW